jgi:hypothetical protein
MRARCVGKMGRDPIRARGGFPTVRTQIENALVVPFHGEPRSSNTHTPDWRCSVGLSSCGANGHARCVGWIFHRAHKIENARLEFPNGGTKRVTINSRGLVVSTAHTRSRPFCWTPQKEDQRVARARLLWRLYIKTKQHIYYQFFLYTL